jgi:beta-mannanase
MTPTPHGAVLAPTPTPAPKPVPTSSRVGVSLPLSSLNAFILATGTRPAELSIYQNWASGHLFDTYAAVTAQAEGTSISVTWEPWSPVGNTPYQPAYSDRAIASGAHDAYILAYARSVRSFDGMVNIRLAHEMNGKWYPWGVGINGNTAADYVAMWRHVYDVFRYAQTTNVRWVWSPNVEFDGDTPMANAYPGGGFVDRVGLSGYNWGIGEYSTWRSFLDLYGPSLDTIRSIAPTKPVYVSEIACSSTGGDKAAWIADFFAQIRLRPWIKGVTWFDQKVAIRDWLIEDNPAAIAAWRKGLKALG